MFICMCVCVVCVCVCVYVFFYLWTTMNLIQFHWGCSFKSKAGLFRKVENRRIFWSMILFLEIVQLLRWLLTTEENESTRKWDENVEIKQTTFFYKKISLFRNKIAFNNVLNVRSCISWIKHGLWHFSVRNN